MRSPLPQLLGKLASPSPRQTTMRSSIGDYQFVIDTQVGELYVRKNVGYYDKYKMFYAQTSSTTPGADACSPAARFYGFNEFDTQSNSLNQSTRLTASPLQQLSRRGMGASSSFASQQLCYSKHECFISYMHQLVRLPCIDKRSNSALVMGPNSLWTAFYFEHVGEIPGVDLLPEESFSDFYTELDEYKKTIDASFSDIALAFSDILQKLTNKMTRTAEWTVFQRDLVVIFERCKSKSLRRALEEIRQECNIKISAHSGPSLAALFKHRGNFKAIELLKMLLNFLFDVDKFESALNYIEQTDTLQAFLAERLKDTNIFRWRYGESDVLEKPRSISQIAAKPKTPGKPVGPPEYRPRTQMLTPGKEELRRPEQVVAPEVVVSDGKEKVVAEDTGSQALQQQQDVAGKQEGEQNGVKKHRFDEIVEQIRAFQQERNLMTYASANEKIEELSLRLKRHTVELFAPCLCHAFGTITLLELGCYIAEQLQKFVDHIQLDQRDTDEAKALRQLSEMKPCTLAEFCGFFEQGLALLRMLDPGLRKNIFQVYNESTGLDLKMCHIRQDVERQISNLESLPVEKRQELRRALEVEVCKLFGTFRFEYTFVLVLQEPKLSAIQGLKSYAVGRYNNFHELISYYRASKKARADFGCNLGVVGQSSQEMAARLLQDFDQLSTKQRQNIKAHLMDDIKDWGHNKDFGVACRQLSAQRNAGQSYAIGQYNNYFELARFWSAVRPQ